MSKGIRNIAIGALQLVIARQPFINHKWPFYLCAVVCFVAGCLWIAKPSGALGEKGKQ